MTPEEKLANAQRMLDEQKRMLERRSETIRRIANELYPLVEMGDAPDRVITAYAIAREAR